MMWAEPAESLGGVYYKIIEPKIHPIRTKWREKSALVFTFITYLIHSSQNFYGNEKWRKLKNEYSWFCLNLGFLEG